MRAFLYTWGGGRTTAEGEHIPFRMDPIALQHAEHISLVLPLTLEHEIDERSPLYGHTYDSLTVRSPLSPLCLRYKAIQPSLYPPFTSMPSHIPPESAQFSAACGHGMHARASEPARQALDAEVVVLFEGVTETGALFSGKRSYLPTEIHWGYTFAEITHQSSSAGRFHAVDLSR